MTANEPMSDERLAWIREWVEKVGPQEAYYGTMRRFMRELLDEVAGAREHAQTAHDQTAELGGHVVQLRAELADAAEANALLRDGSKKLRAELGRCAELNRNLVNENATLMAERDQAREALAELRGRLRAEYGYRYRNSSDNEPEVTGYDDEETTRLLAAHGDTIMRRLRTDWEAADDGQ